MGTNFDVLNIINAMYVTNFSIYILTLTAQCYLKGIQNSLHT